VFPFAQFLLLLFLADRGEGADGHTLVRPDLVMDGMATVAHHG